MRDLISRRFQTYKEGYEAAGNSQFILLPVFKPLPVRAWRPCCNPDDDFIEDKSFVQVAEPLCREVEYRLTQFQDPRGNRWWQFSES